MWPSRSKRVDNHIHIRPAAREDLDALFELDQACFRPGIAYSKTELRYYLFHPRSISVIAEDDTGIAGFAIVEFLLEEGRRIGHVITIDVPVARRRSGVGRLLMEALLDPCRETDAATVRLEVAVDNEAAIAFYRRLGFTEMGRMRGYYMGKLDALTMRIALHSNS
jgi:[ribosomal protein S18]-alanine N-acetyltransferase